MKKILSFTLLLFMGMFLITSCEDDKTYTGDMQFRLLTTAGDFYIKQKANGNDSLVIKVQAVGKVPSKDVTLNIAVNASKTDAVANVDYILPTTVTIPAGQVEASFVLQGIFDGVSDNNIDTLNFSITSEDYTIMPLYTTCNIRLRMVSPLNSWIGNYSGAAVSQQKPGAWDELWNLTVGLDPVDPAHKLAIKGFAGGSTVSFVGTVDLAAETITFAAGQNLGDTYGYGDVAVYSGSYNGSSYVFTGTSTTPIVGTINKTTYAMQIPDVLEVLISGDYAGSAWDAFDVTVTKK